MIKITLPDGSIREYEAGVTSHEVAMSISERLARNVLAAEVNGEIINSNRPINTDVNMSLLQWKDKGGKSTMWHSSPHLMAEAIEFHYPGVKLPNGHQIENGFYYDVDCGDYEFSDKELKKI